MLETVELLNIFWDMWYCFQDTLINIMLKSVTICMHYQFGVSHLIIFYNLILLFNKDVLKG